MPKDSKQAKKTLSISNKPKNSQIKKQNKAKPTKVQKVVAPKMSQEEKKLRDELGAAYRILFSLGIYEACDTHLSVCLDDQDAFLTLPYGILWKYVQPEDFVLVAFDGTILRASKRINAITGQPHRPDITAVTLHSPFH
jgi:hypothetical protein